jgi:hypothetical protein
MSQEQQQSMCLQMTIFLLLMGEYVKTNPEAAVPSAADAWKDRLRMLQTIQLAFLCTNT